MLSEENKKKAKLIAEGVSVIKVAKEFNVSHQGVYKLMKLNEEFAMYIKGQKLWDTNQEIIKKICNYVYNKFYKTIDYDEIYNIAYIELFTNEDVKDLKYLLYRLKYLCRCEINERETVTDFTDELTVNELKLFE